MIHKPRRNRAYQLVGLATMVVTLSFLLVTFTQSTKLFKTSVLDLPTHAPFDGTVYPIQKVPNWVKSNIDNHTADYNALSSSQLIDIPYYRASELATPTDNLAWGDPEDDAVRNAKLTYSVPYLGTYLLDGIEGAGSHPAVDIRIPVNTPVYAIANGVVTKVSVQSTGFGNHVVIKHENVPTLNDPNQLETLYSSYSHLGDIDVDEGDVVKKGQQIALSGNTGTSTTPHIHFQIDNSNAPWNPYWPFTWSEASDAGLDFFGAVNAGLGQSKAKSTTVHPLEYVQAYLDGEIETVEHPKVVESVPEPEPVVEEEPRNVIEDTSSINLGDSNVGSYAASLANSDSEPVAEEAVVEIVEEEVTVEPEPEPEPDPTFSFVVESRYVVGSDSQFTLYSNGFSEEILIKSDRGLVSPEHAIVRHWGFDGGKLESSFRRMKPGRDRLYVEYDGETYFSDWFEVIELKSEPTFRDVSGSHDNFEAIAYLADEEVINGYPDETFRPEKIVSRVEALKFILAATDANLSRGSLNFTDISDREWYFEYLYTAYKEQIVNGYEDKTFRPGNTVIRAEFFKMLYNALGEGELPNVRVNPYPDVPKGEWYAPYVQYAKDLGVVDKNMARFEPAKQMTRAEVAEAMYRLMQR